MARKRTRSRRLSGVLNMEKEARSKCFREFRGRQPLVEECLEAVAKTGGVVIEFEMTYHDAADHVSRECLKIKNLDHQTACITGAGEALKKSFGHAATLDGRRKRAPIKGLGSIVVYPQKWGFEVEADSYNDLARWMNQNRKKIGKAKEVIADFII